MLAPRFVRRNAPRALLCLLVVLTSGSARAWIFHEHVTLAHAGLGRLADDERTTMEELWALGRGTRPSQLCAALSVPAGTSSCIDFADLAALGGDHACTVDELVATSKTAHWILDVLATAAQSAHDLETARDEARRRDVWGLSHLRLERIDDDYASRAAANRSHFLLPRRSDVLEEYIAQVLAPTTEPNALGLYIVLHAGALRFASEASASSDPSDRQRLAAEAITAEAFALHFLEDAFSSGHAVGSWGDDATRKGTHDYYSEHGIEGLTWDGRIQTSYGDAHLSPIDVANATPVVADSLRQLIAAYLGAGATLAAPSTVSASYAATVARFDVCHALAMPPPPSRAVIDAAAPVTRATTMPGKDGAVHLPRFRTEVGWFFGAFSGARFGGALGGYETSASALRFVGSLEVGARVGFGLEGVMGSVGDGLMFLQGGAVAAGAQLDGPCGTCPPDHRTSQLHPRAGGRSAMAWRLRAPYWLLPGDLLVATPILALVNFPTLKRMGMSAADGGLLGIQRLLVTKVGTVQFVLGREVGVTFYGYVGGPDPYDSYAGTVPDLSGTTTSAYRTVQYRSIEVDVPVVEYRPVRAFDAHTAVGILVQGGVALDVPTEATYVDTGAPFFLGPTAIFYARVAFDARLYP